MGEKQQKNVYDKEDFIRREKVLLAGNLKMAAYKVRDPETGIFGPIQYHATWDNTVMAVMNEEVAKLFAKFIQE